LLLNTPGFFVYWVLRTLSLRVKMLGCDADHPPRAGGYETLELYLHKKAKAHSGL
jgi:hypothetical protein